MKHEIDLGSEIVINVKYAGMEYALREPTVEELQSFSEITKGLEDKGSVEPIVNLLVTLGMPKDVVLKMGMSKSRQLIDGLTDLISKKK